MDSACELVRHLYNGITVLGIVLFAFDKSL